MHAIIYAVLAGLCWGVGEVATKSVLHTGKVGPITAVTVRTVVAAPIMIIGYLVATRAIRSAAEPPDWLHAGAPTLARLVLGSGVCAGALGALFFYVALGVGEISRVKPIAFTVAPACGVLLGWLLLGEPMTIRKIIAVTLVLVGVVLLSTG
jgi:uncharacterized membrane protein